LGNLNPFKKDLGEIFKSKFEFKSDGDDFLIKIADEGKKLIVPFASEDLYGLAVDNSLQDQTHIFIGHCNGQVEEVIF
jgi:hypothetical protein